MSRNQHYRMMSLLIGIFLMAMMMSKYNVEAFPLIELESNEENEHWSLKRLRQLVHKLQWNDDEELFFEARTDPVGDCTADIIEGYQYIGENTMAIGGIDTAQRCMDKCDINAKCMGWSYDVAGKNCWGFTAIKGLTPSANIKSGSCIGTSLKARCTEQQKQNLIGWEDQKLDNIATVENCMAMCDQSKICFGWLYSSYDQKCSLYHGVDSFAASDYFISGSCLAPQQRIRVADPIKIFRQEALDRHNEKRKEHCSPELTLDDNLNQISQDLANTLAAADVIPPVYQGTNLQTVYFTKADLAVSGAIPVDCFYDENKYYNWNTPDFSSTNHFPKIIWKSSKLLGVGRAVGSNGITMYIVLTYDWEGDIAASYNDNVLPKCT